MFIRLRIKIYHFTRAVRRNPEPWILLVSMLLVAVGVGVRMGWELGCAVMGVVMLGEMMFSRVLEHRICMRRLQIAGDLEAARGLAVKK